MYRGNNAKSQQRESNSLPVAMGGNCKITLIKCEAIFAFKPT